MRHVWTVVLVAGGLLVMSSLVNVDYRSPCTAPELTTIQNIRVLHAAEAQFRSQYGRYAELFELGRNGSDLFPTGLASGPGYSFQLRIRGSGYTVSAVPVQFAKTGRRCFYSDETGVIHQNWGAEPATIDSPVLH